MSIFDHMNPFASTPGLDPSLEALIYGLEKAVTRHKIADTALGVFDEEDDLREEGMRLDNQIKRRALGMNSTEEFNDVNNGFTQLLAGTLGHGIQKIPEPGFLRPNMGGGSLGMKLSSGLTSKGFEHGASSAIRRGLPRFLRIFG